MRGSHLKATSLSQPLSSSVAESFGDRGIICSLMLGKYVGSLRHVIVVEA